MNIIEISNKEQKQQIVKNVLEALPDWFGIPEATKEYIDNSRSMPLAAAYDNNKVIGFVSLKETSRYTAEIYVMGILPEYHRKGCGKALFHWAYHYAKSSGYEFLQVKTLDESAHCVEYDQTREFYKAMGFRELECFKTLWDEWNPCLVMVMNITNSYRDNRTHSRD